MVAKEKVHPKEEAIEEPKGYYWIRCGQKKQLVNRRLYHNLKKMSLVVPHYEQNKAQERIT